MAGLEGIRGAITFTEYQYRWPERIVVDTVMKARAIGMEALNHTAVTAMAREGDHWRVTLTAAEESRDVLARATCYKLTRNVAFTRAVAFHNDEDDPIAHSVGTFMISTKAGTKKS